MMKIMDAPNSSKEPGGFWEAYRGVHGREPGTAGSFAILSAYAEDHGLCQ
jgi:hypothetical protein